MALIPSSNSYVFGIETSGKIAPLSFVNKRIAILAYFLLSLPIFTIIIAMNTTPATNTEGSTFSSSVDSQIEASQAKTDRLTKQANGWNVWYLRFLVLSIAVGGATVFCQYKAIKESRNVSDAQSELLHLKDIKATNDSRDKDQRIADVNSAAGVANQEAGRANERAAKAEERAAAADERAGKANQEAARLSRETEELRSSNLATGEKLVAAQSSLEQEKRERLAMEDAISPRLLNQSPSWLTGLKRFPVTYEIVVIPDFETRRTASQLVVALKFAGWKQAEPGALILHDSSVPDGITIYFKEHDRPKDDISGFAASALSEYLTKNKMQNDMGTDNKLPPNTLRIVVGAKPIDPRFFRNLREQK